MSERTKEQYMEEVIALRTLVRRLRDGMRASEECGCTDHLDCWESAPQMWYAPLDEADNVLGGEQ